ncbi:unnamed protein product [Sphenostylis stenocarpa]|uniref:Uncharacterized protein n=1 Tax=Sphenostylis stenocarpa TaxID=92480 RepID=A0AA86VII7_9FABA|nr:unnamed protein product [Sphenostylis stenocarpa]
MGTGGGAAVVREQCCSELMVTKNAGGSGRIGCMQCYTELVVMGNAASGDKTGCMQRRSRLQSKIVNFPANLRKPMPVHIGKVGIGTKPETNAYERRQAWGASSDKS